MNLFETKNWEVVFVSWEQAFPGNCIISNKNKRETLSDLNTSEWEELGKIEKELERVCKKLFKATMFNFACLMNNAYRDNETPHVHFHFIPRYNHELVLFDKKYVDKHFGYNFWKWSNNKFKYQKNIFTKDEILQIFEMMKKEIKFN